MSTSGFPALPYNHNVAKQGNAMTEQDAAIKHNALAGHSAEVLSLIEQAKADANGDTANHLETVWLKYGAHELFQQTKGDVSAIHNDMPSLASDDPAGELDKYERSIADYLRLFNDETRGVVGEGGLTPEQIRQSALDNLSAAVQDWRARGVTDAPVKSQLAVLADNPWENERLREVIVENWSGGVKQGLWTLASVTSAEARSRLEAGMASTEVANWYKPAAEELFGEVMGIVDRAISETQPRPKGLDNEVAE